MTALKALAILEGAVLECKKRNVNTPECLVVAALSDLRKRFVATWRATDFRGSASRRAG
jgi:hypothetical protein